MHADPSVLPLPVAQPGPVALVQPAQSIEAADDAQAVTLWLRTYAGGPAHTMRSYRKEARRFMAWLYATREPNPSLLPYVTLRDVDDFTAWLLSEKPLPEPALRLAGVPRQAKRGALNPVSIRQALVILHTLYAALANFRGPSGPYAPYNPFHAARKRVKGPRHANPRRRALSVEEWSLVQRALAEMPDDSAALRYQKARARWVFALLYRLWARRSEVWHHSMGQIVRTPEGWQIDVLGKGNKERTIPVTTALIQEMRAYRRGVGWTDYPTPGESTPLVGSKVDPAERVTDQAIYDLVKEIGARAAAMAPDEVAAARLRKMSPHWLRHTGISRFLDAEGDPRHARVVAGHASSATTDNYDTTQFQRVRNDMERNW